MPKVSVSTTARVEVGLEPRVKAQIRTALTEYCDLQAQIKRLTERQDAIKADVQAKFDEADALDALVDGTDVDGIKVKLVIGSSRRLDKMKLMKRHGLTQADLDACSPEKPNKPYVRVTARGAKEEE